MRHLNTTSLTTLSVFLLGAYEAAAYNLSTVIYDTDASMHGAFTCDGYPNTGNNPCYYSNAPFNYSGNGASYTVPCIGVTRGIVSEYLNPTTKKLEYISQSSCFESNEAFGAMFQKKDGITALHCRDIPMNQNAYDAWEYDSDSKSTRRFSPLDDLQDSIRLGTCTGDCANAAQTRYSQGNAIFSSYWQEMDYVGNSRFDYYKVSDGEFSSGTYPDIYSSWDRPSGYSNQHFCMEIHGQFEYQNGLEFFFRADDDLWVYIDNRIAVDLGGNHLTAPAYVRLDDFFGSSEEFIIGNKYDIDIFYCDRRTTNSTFRIKTNAYITQKVAESTTASLTFHAEIANDNTVAYPLCYTEALSSCEASAQLSPKTWCEGDIPKTISYSLETEDRTLIHDGFESGTAWSIYYGGIDLTEQGNPKINVSAMTDLVPGRYNLVIKTSDATQKIPFEIVAEEEPDEESPCEEAPVCCPAVNINITINMNVIVIGGTPYVFGTDSLMQIIQTAFGDYAGLINTDVQDVNNVEKQTVLDTVRYVETQTLVDTVRYIETLTTLDTVRYVETKTHVDTIRYFETIIDTLHYIETKTIIDTLHYVTTQTITDTLHFIETKTIVDTLHFVENKVVIDTIRYTDNTPNQKSRFSSQDVASEKTNSDYVMTICLEKGTSLSYLRRDGNKLVSDGKISLFDLRGNLITRKNNSIDLNSMNSGIYIAKSGKKILRIAIQPSH